MAKRKNTNEQLKAWMDGISNMNLSRKEKEHSVDFSTSLIKEWAFERGLHHAKPSNQMLKLGEEYGELCEAIAKNKKTEVAKDAIGDMYVVLVILSMQLEVDIEECIALAYEEIKDRKGKTVNGVFVKEEDL